MPSCDMNLMTIRRDCLRVLNGFRRRHNLTPLIYEQELEKSAVTWSVVLARLARLAFSPDTGRYYGETTTFKRRATNNLTGWEIAALWYAEGYRYTYDIEGSTDVNCNFTQIIWASTREFGLGITLSKEGDAYIVGHYRQMGNIPGAFKFNVFPQCPLYRPSQPDLYEMNIVGVNEHNRCRKRHGATPLILCHDLIASAQLWADNLAPLHGKIIYSNKCSTGESIAYKFEPLGFICSRQISESWYRCGRNYDYVHFALGSMADFFTQMIWRGTTDIGFGRATHEGHHYLVAHYRPPGNRTLDFEENIRGVIDDFL